MKYDGTRLLMRQSHGQYDGHCHVFRADLPMVDNRRYTPGDHALPDTLCGLLAEHKLDGALLVQPSFLGFDNSFLLQSLAGLREYKELTFRGVVVLDPQCVTSPAELDKMESHGVIGLRLNLYKKEKEFEYSHWRKLLYAVEDRGWHVELHCGADYLPSLLPVLTNNHRNVVVDHYGLVGDAQQCQGFKTILSLPANRLWVKFSAPYRLQKSIEKTGYKTLADAISQLENAYIEHLGTGRIVWGSDWPFTQHEKHIAYPGLLENIRDTSIQSI